MWILIIAIAVGLIMAGLAFWLFLDKIFATISHIATYSTKILGHIVETRDLTAETSAHMREALVLQCAELKKENEHLLNLIRFFKERDDRFQKQVVEVKTKQTEVIEISKNLIKIADKREKKE